MKERRRRTVLVVLLAVLMFVGAYYDSQRAPEPAFETVNSVQVADTELATAALERLEVKGRAPKTGYSRSQFGDGWADFGTCDTRNLILKRDLAPTKIDVDGCSVLSGALRDPYTGEQVQFARGSTTSSLVQIDHVVALSDAWQKGAQGLSAQRRLEFANDGLNLLAVDGPANRNKGDGDAATWLPANKAYRCQYIARQVAVKTKYKLWVTPAERDAMDRVLSKCPAQRLPVGSQIR